MSLIKTLLENKLVDVNCADSEGETALLNTARNENLIIAKYLLENGASVDKCSCTSAYFPLAMAATEGHLEFVKLMVIIKFYYNQINYQ